MTKYILPFLIAVIISFITTPLVRRLAFKIGAIDIPKDSRRVHKEPMPLIGGLVNFCCHPSYLNISSTNKRNYLYNNRCNYYRSRRNNR